MSKNEKGVAEVVVIGGSAGALDGLRELLSLLPSDFPGVILIVVHIPNEFPSYLASILNRAGRLPVTEVHRRERLGRAGGRAKTDTVQPSTRCSERPRGPMAEG